MNVKDAVKKRRAYRNIEPVVIDDDIVHELIDAARLAPSCFNKQPWRFVFVRSEEKLQMMKQVYSDGNEWAHKGSAVVAVFASKESDCVIRDREYYLFDTGIAVGQMLLRATELGLVAHPIAGYSPDKVHKILSIPDKFNIITLLVIGKKTDAQDDESERPERSGYSEICYNEQFNS
ncbi:MAG: nitroreductase family protein [Spirochaetes bacterium]|nr:nitroreductase family protein [Spirochaetota bacterium]MBN2771846.1 nitroreductase family protein [Spirochaetota bacterium]